MGLSSARSEKQIFIAIDKLSSYDDKAAQIINKHKVLQLSKDKLLFIKNWKSSDGTLVPRHLEDI